MQIQNLTFLRGTVKMNSLTALHSYTIQQVFKGLGACSEIVQTMLYVRGCKENEQNYFRLSNDNNKAHANCIYMLYLSCVHSVIFHY